MDATGREKNSLAGRITGLCLDNKLVIALLVLVIVAWGIMVAPFDWDTGWLPRDPVAVDAIPDIGENQQIVFTQWMGRSPRDIEDQVTYPMTAALLGIPGVRTIRSYSFFGYSTIYLIFGEEAGFYESRTRILEKLSALPPETLPDGVRPALGPDATALGQVFWYTLEGLDGNGDPAGGWDLHELRSIQDWNVRYALMSAEGVAEVASIGGFVQEYQIDVDPDAMTANGVTLPEVFKAVRMSNVDVGARTIEVNMVEYVIRGLGFIESVRDIENTVIRERDNVPVCIRDIATVALGPAMRRGALDKGGAEAVGGVVVVRYGENPLRVIKNVKEKIREISRGLPERTLEDGTRSKVSIVPFYDRTGLIYETLDTLNTALIDEILVTVIVVLLMVMHLGSSLLISGLLPLTILLVFIAMKAFGVDANIVALSGIAIAIGTIVDMGIVVSENILKHMRAAPEGAPARGVIHEAVSEVAGAVLTAIATTVVSFLPVFTMVAAEGKLFKPLAYTKTFALLASVLIALAVIPPVAHLLYRRRRTGRLLEGRASRTANSAIVALVVILLAGHWRPLGYGRHYLANLVFVAALIGGFLYLFKLLLRYYEPLLRWCLGHRKLFLSMPIILILLGGAVWMGMGREFMPPLDEGSFLYMPTTMPHASIGEAMDVLRKQDMAFSAIPEVESVVGKIGRAESPLDPAPVSMIETVISYRDEYITDKDGHPLRFRYDGGSGDFVRDDDGGLIPDRNGKPYRNWREHIESPDDIWDEIVKAGRLTGTTSAPKLQPISTRLVMLQSGMRAPMGIKVRGPDLEKIEKFGFELERLLKQVPQVEQTTVIADRIVGKPYLEIDIDREALARYGIHIRGVQDVIEVAVGGRKITTTVEGRERYPVRVRYKRELRDTPETIGRVLVPAMNGAVVPLRELAEIRFVRGPMVIKAEDTFLTGYVIFDGKPGLAEVDVVGAAGEYLDRMIGEGKLEVPEGVSYSFAGSYENQVRSEKKLAVVLPLALLIIFMILYFQFRDVPVTLLVFSGIFVAWAGGFIMLWLYGRSWFLDFSILGVDMRELFRIRQFNLSVAVWVGFLALFGIASDDGVIFSTYIGQVLRKHRPASAEGIREAVVEAGRRRIRPALMTSATTILALIPVLTSTGRGSEIMVPMAIPSFGGMMVVVVSVFLVPVLYSMLAERRLKGPPAGGTGKVPDEITGV